MTTVKSIDLRNQVNYKGNSKTCFEYKGGSNGMVTFFVNMIDDKCYSCVKVVAVKDKTTTRAYTNSSQPAYPSNMGIISAPKHGINSASKHGINILLDKEEVDGVKYIQGAYQEAVTT